MRQFFQVNENKKLRIKNSSIGFYLQNQLLT